MRLRIDCTSASAPRHSGISSEATSKLSACAFKQLLIDSKSTPVNRLFQTGVLPPLLSPAIMATTSSPIDPLLRGSSGKSSRGLLRIIILCTIAAAAVSARLFSVIRFESIIHEFDPWFNFRATKYLVKHGFYSFWDWFDDRKPAHALKASLEDQEHMN
jgi:hypothetical protein